MLLSSDLGDFARPICKSAQTCARAIYCGRATKFPVWTEYSSFQRELGCARARVQVCALVKCALQLCTIVHTTMLDPKNFN